MKTSQFLWRLAVLTVLLLPSFACSDGDSGGLLGTSSVNLLTEGITVGADPPKIELDPNDPDAPRDPQTNKLIGKTTVGAQVVDGDGAPTVGVEVTFTTSAGRLESDGEPILTDDNGLVTDTLAVDEDDVGEVEVTATTTEFSGRVVVPVVLVPLNSPPTADAGEDQTVECPVVTLDGSGSSDPDSTEGTNDDIKTFEWFVGRMKIAEGEIVDVKLPLGTTVVTLVVTDTTGASDSDETTITAVDTLPPRVKLTMSPAELWPPNHQMRNVEAVLRIRDCDPHPTIELVSVTSSEPDNGNGDGNTEPDIRGVEPGTDDTRFQLRAERAGGGDGRTYRVVYRVTDSQGLSTMATAEVVVPHDQGH